MCGRREPAHVDSDLGDNDVSAEVLDARNRHYEVDCGAKGPKVRLHLRVDKAQAGHYRLFVNVETATASMQQFHCFLPGCASSAWGPVNKNSKKRAPRPM